MLIAQIVIDTNVIVAGLRSRNGSAFKLLSQVRSEQLTYNTRDFTDIERFGISAVTPAAFLESIGALS
jgi:hypothetical protein